MAYGWMPDKKDRPDYEVEFETLEGLETARAIFEYEERFPFNQRMAKVFDFLEEQGIDYYIL